MKSNPLKKWETLGQSIRLAYIRPGPITSGELRRLIDEDGLRGMTPNPSIFNKAICRDEEQMIARSVRRAFGLGVTSEKGNSDHATNYISRLNLFSTTGVPP